LHYAIQHSDHATWQLLHAGAELTPEGADVPLLALACAAPRSIDILEYLLPFLAPQLSVRVQLNHLDDDDDDDDDKVVWSGTALHFAVQQAQVALVKVLLPPHDQHALNALKVKRVSDGWTPFMLACALGLGEIVLCMVARGASLEEDDAQPLKLLLENGHQAVIDALIETHAISCDHACAWTTTATNHIDKDNQDEGESSSITEVREMEVELRESGVYIEPDVTIH
jgi:ankyrin repeat protein